MLILEALPYWKYDARTWIWTAGFLYRGKYYEGQSVVLLFAGLIAFWKYVLRDCL